MNEAVSFGLKRMGDIFILSIPLSPKILWSVWFLALCAFVFVSWVLVHHWGYYGVKENRKVFAKTIYFVGGIGAIIVSALFITAFSFIS